MRTPRTLATIALVIASALASTPAASQDLPPVFAGLLGEWTGRGTLMGRSAVFTMSWSSALGGRFVRLEFTNGLAPAEEGGDATPVLAASAMYRPAADGAAAEGSWFDTRGMILPLRSTLTATELVTEWGDEATERGRTTYRLAGPDRVEVVDEVLRDGAYGEFGRAEYVRAR